MSGHCHNADTVIMSILYILTIMVIALLALVIFQLQYEYFPTQIRDITEDFSWWMEKKWKLIANCTYSGGHLVNALDQHFMWCSSSKCDNKAASQGSSSWRMENLHLQKGSLYVLQYTYPFKMSFWFLYIW